MRTRVIVVLCLLCQLLGATVLAVAAESPLILGVFPRRSAKDTIHDFTPLADYLSRVLGRTVKLETAPDFNSFWQGVSTLRYDIVHFNQYHYIRSHKKLGYDVIAMNEEYGRATITGTIAVKRNKGFKSLTDLKGGKIVFGGGPKAMMSYIVPTYLLSRNGLTHTDYKEEFAKNPPNAILAVCLDQAIAAGVGDSILDLPSVKAKCDTSTLTYLAVSEQLAHLPWAVKSSLPQSIRKNVQTLLVNLKSTPHGRSVLKSIGVTNLLLADDHDYDKHRDIIAHVTGEHY